jgi:hypothetical protein
LKGHLKSRLSEKQKMKMFDFVLGKVGNDLKCRIYILMRSCFTFIMMITSDGFYKMMTKNDGLIASIKEMLFFLKEQHI